MYVLSEQIHIPLNGFKKGNTFLSLSLSSDGNTLLISEYCSMPINANVWICHYNTTEYCWSKIELVDTKFYAPCSMSLSSDGKKAVIGFSNGLITGSIKIFSISF